MPYLLSASNGRPLPKHISSTSNNLVSSQFGQFTTWCSQLDLFTTWSVHNLVNSKLGHFTTWSVNKLIYLQFGLFIIWSCHNLVSSQFGQLLICSDQNLVDSEFALLLFWSLHNLISSHFGQFKTWSVNTSQLDLFTIWSIQNLVSSQLGLVKTRSVHKLICSHLFLDGDLTYLRWNLKYTNKKWNKQNICGGGENSYTRVSELLRFKILCLFSDKTCYWISKLRYSKTGM